MFPEAKGVKSGSLFGVEFYREKTLSCPTSILTPRVLITGRPWLFRRVLGRKGTVEGINTKLSFLGWRLIL